MTPEQFCYWLQGFFELENPTSLDLNQTEEVKNHLKKVFNKVSSVRLNDIREFLMPEKKSADFIDYSQYPQYSC